VLKAAAEAFRRASPAERLLAALASAFYLTQGIWLPLLSSGFDFAAFHKAAWQVAHGQGALIYEDLFALKPGGPQPIFYMYPPAVALLYAPLGLLGFQTARILHLIVGHAALWGAVCLWSGNDGRKLWRAAAAALVFYPVYYCLQVGQSDLIALFLVVAALRAEEKGRLGLAGALLAVAALLKLFLLLLPAALLLRRRWAGAAAFLAAFAGFAAASLRWVPPEVQSVYWARLASPLGVEGFYDNHSITGLVYRLFTTGRYSQGLADILDLARTTQLGLSALVAAAFLLAALTRRWSARGLAAFALVTALLLSPMSDTHHQVLLLPAFWLLLEAPNPAAAPLLLFAVSAALPLAAFRYAGTEAVQAAASAGWLIFSGGFAALAALWALCAKSLPEA
jgi:hypothetical protein